LLSSAHAVLPHNTPAVMAASPVSCLNFISAMLLSVPAMRFR
jgi:hypothetical protein